MGSTSNTELAMSETVQRVETHSVMERIFFFYSTWQASVNLYQINLGIGYFGPIHSFKCMRELR